MGAAGVKWARMVTDIGDIETVAADGFDAAELPVALLMDLDTGVLPAELSRIRGTGLVFDVFSAPLPAGARVTEQGFNIYVWSEYLKKALDRVAALGGRRIVWSDGKSRILPVEGEREAAKRQALQFLFMLSDIASGYGIDVLVEPLDPRRTNFLNTMTEVVEFLNLVGRPNLSSVVSYRDIAAIGFDEASFNTHQSSVAHVYLDNPGASPGTRLSPREGDGANYAPFLEQLSRIRYAGNISVPEDADAESLRFCRSLIG